MTDEEKAKEIEENNKMSYLVRKIVYAHAEDYTIDEEERLKLLEWIDNNI